MTLEEQFQNYRIFVENGVNLSEDTIRERLLLSMGGLGGESGEVVDELKKITMHRKEIDVTKMIDEMGDVLWYYVLLMNTLGVDFDQIMEYNTKKLTARHPHKHGGDVNA